MSSHDSDAPTRPLPYGRQSINDDDVARVIDTLRGDWLTQGPAVAEFEAALCEATGASHAIALANGTAALHLAALALGVGPKDLGVTSAITFVASANCVRFAGGEVAFADVDPRTGLIDCDDLERLIDALPAPPKLIVPVDLAGQPADLPRVQAIANRVGARVLQDACHALGATYQVDGATVRAGACEHADAAILSFHPVKHITTGEGGAVLTNDAEVAERVRGLRTHGVHKDAARLQRADDDPWAGPWYYEQDQLGFNYRLSDIHAVLGASQMARLDEMVARRREIARRYDAAFEASERVTPLAKHTGRESAYHLYVVQVKGAEDEAPEQLARRRKSLYTHLREHAIYAQVHYIPVPWQPYYRAREKQPGQGALAGAERYYAASLSLPMFPDMDDADVDRVVDVIERWSGA